MLAEIRARALAEIREETLAKARKEAREEPRERAGEKAPGGGVRGESLVDIRKNLGWCKRCGLHEGRENIVFGAGRADARLVFVGEGPGVDEDKTGEPFVGAAGRLLTKIIQAIKHERDQVYICNIIKCRPP
ncbi:MAG: uracil-DNA glycosylase, partial [Desulfobacterales bacterium]|nr:uracil-DNA glycosylase [Desulfobacterales bacterium]